MNIVIDFENFYAGQQAYNAFSLGITQAVF